MALLVDLTLQELRQEDAKRSNELLVGLASWNSPTSPRYAAIWRAIEDDEDAPRLRIIAVFLQDEPFVATGPLVSPILLTMTGAPSRFGGPPGVATTVVYEEYAPGEALPAVSFVASEFEGDLMKRTEVAPTSEPLAVDAVWYRKEDVGDSHFRVAGLFRSNAATAVWGVHLTPQAVLDSELRWESSAAAAARSFKRVHVAIPSPSTKAGKRQALLLMRGDAYEPWRADLNAASPAFGLQEGGTVVDGYPFTTLGLA